MNTPVRVLILWSNMTQQQYLINNYIYIYICQHIVVLIHICKTWNKLLTVEPVE